MKKILSFLMLFPLSAFAQSEHDPLSTGATVAIFVVSGIVYFVIARWVFAIDKRVKQNDKIISLLTALAVQAGATKEMIYADELNVLAKEKKKGNITEEYLQNEKAKLFNGNL